MVAMNVDKLSISDCGIHELSGEDGLEVPIVGKQDHNTIAEELCKHPLDASTLGICVDRFKDENLRWEAPRSSSFFLPTIFMGLLLAQCPYIELPISDSSFEFPQLAGRRITTSNTNRKKVEKKKRKLEVIIETIVTNWDLVSTNEELKRKKGKAPLVVEVLKESLDSSPPKATPTTTLNWGMQVSL
eukprot:Gb_03165 [translate_table: standard]